MSEIKKDNRFKNRRKNKKKGVKSKEVEVKEFFRRERRVRFNKRTEEKARVPEEVKGDLEE